MVTDLCLRLLTFNIFKLLFLKKHQNIDAKFHMEPPWDVENENLFKCSRSHDQDDFQAHIWNNIKILLLRNLETWYTAWGTQVLPNLFKWWPWIDLDHFVTWSNLFPNASAWVKAYLQHIVIYFQACSNSAYPQHSGERYRTIDPLVSDFLDCFRMSWINFLNRTVLWNQYPPPPPHPLLHAYVNIEIIILRFYGVMKTLA